MPNFSDDRNEKQNTSSRIHLFNLLSIRLYHFAHLGSTRLWAFFLPGRGKMIRERESKTVAHTTGREFSPHPPVFVQFFFQPTNNRWDSAGKDGWIYAGLTGSLFCKRFGIWILYSWRLYLRGSVCYVEDRIG